MGWSLSLTPRVKQSLWVVPDKRVRPVPSWPGAFSHPLCTRGTFAGTSGCSLSPAMSAWVHSRSHFNLEKGVGTHTGRHQEGAGLCGPRAAPESKDRRQLPRLRRTGASRPAGLCAGASGQRWTRRGRGRTHRPGRAPGRRRAQCLPSPGAETSGRRGCTRILSPRRRVGPGAAQGARSLALPSAPGRPRFPPRGP